MRATVMYGAGDVRVEDVPDARLIEPTDALVRVTRAAICGSDLWPYKSMPHDDAGRRMGHEFIGVVDAVGSDVVTVKVGDLVVSPFLWSDGSCVFCREGLQSACLHGGRYGFADIDGGQGEAVRVPQADGTLVVLPVDEDDALMPSLLTLSDVMGTGHHAALAAQVGPGKTVAVVGDGAVGLCGVIASKRLGAERIILLGKNPERIALGQEFGATDIVRERGDDAVERVRELTEHGAHSVLECVGLEQAVETALAIARPGGAIGRVGVPEHDSTPTGVAFWKNAAMGGGPAPGPRLHRRTAPGRARGPHRTGSRVRPHRLDRRRAGRLPSDERPRSPQVPDQALSKERFMTMTIPTLTLNSGVELPALGFGVFQTPPDETVAAVEAALAVGYRHIDTAAAYGNEREVGEAIRRSGIDRSDVFIETKVWISDYGYDETLHAFEKSAAKLGVEQIDLLILHQPLPSEFERTIAAYKALEKLLADGKVRAIGVSNFLPDYLESLLVQTDVVPAVNQIELHPYFTQVETRKLDARHGILTQAWSPIGGITAYRDGMPKRTFDDPTILAIADAHGKTAAQVMLRWHVQEGRSAIPKSVRHERIAENFDIFDFDLSDTELEAIDNLDTGVRGGPDPADVTLEGFGGPIPQA